MSKNEEKDLISLLHILNRNKTQIFLTVLVFSIIGTIVAFIWPKTFTSSLTYIVNNNQSINLSGGSGLLSGLTSIAPNNKQITSDQTILLARSTALVDQVIEEFRLDTVYNSDIPESNRKAFNNNLKINELREGGLGFNSIIATELSFNDKSAKRSFEILSYLYESLNNKVISLNKQSIEQSFKMLEKRFEQNITELRASEDSLLAFQNKNGIVLLDEQTRALIENIAKVKTEIVNLELQIAYSKALLNKNSQTIQELNTRLESTKDAYNKLLTTEESNSEYTVELFQPFSEIPSLSILYYRLFREFQIQQELYKVLYPQYEQQLLSINEISSGMTLLDPPIIPTYKSSPKRAYIMIAFFLSGFFISVLYSLIKEWINDLKKHNPDTYVRLMNSFKS